jgi:GNAT superfamily N-acetyltransferase
MAMTSIRPAEGRFDDVAAMLGGGIPEKACWCLTYRLSPAALKVGRPEAMRGLCSREPGPGLLAYIDEQPVGWCGVGPRSEFHRLTHSRTIQQVDDRPVWSIVCFVVKAGYRGRGVAGDLLDAAGEFAREGGAPSVEGYPIDSSGGKVSSSLAYPGTTELFERAGFSKIAPTSSKSGGLVRWIVSRDL